MAATSEVEDYHTELIQETISETDAAPEGGLREEVFTQIVLRMLEDAGETENSRECRDVKEDSLGRPLHRVNGYALSEGYETLDLFVTIYRGGGAPESVPRAEMARAAAQTVRFLKAATGRSYAEEVEESSPVFDIAHTLHAFGDRLARVNVYVLSDGLIGADAPEEEEVLGGTPVYFYIRDLGYLQRLAAAKGERIPIEIDFEGEYGGPIPCLPLPGSNDVYESYLATIPGSVLASVYQTYGFRLLEQNVRAFLQFTGKINKGIRDTLRNEPEMFFAYNNGIAATAERVDVEMTESGPTIRRVSDLQIVNGGQTTASLFHTGRKDRVDLGSVYVPMKLSVVRDPSRLGDIVPRIARYANSQNRVTEADLSSSNPFHIELERLSRVVWASPPGRQRQTRWFYERARGQYKNAMNREGYTPKRRKVFEAQNPRNQVLRKEDVAKYESAWVGRPWMVVRGRQKNYAEYMRSLRSTPPDRAFFEDVAAMALVYREAEKLYGTKAQAHVIGDMRYITVPYSISYLNSQIEKEIGRPIDLYKIWQRQAMSDDHSAALRSVMERVDASIKAGAPGGLVGEWAKKEECWDYVRSLDVGVPVSPLRDDTVDPASPRPSYDEGIQGLEAAERVRIVSGVPAPTWRRIQGWMRENCPGDIRGRAVADVASKAFAGKALSSSETTAGLGILELVQEKAPSLLDDADEAAEQIRTRVEERAREVGGIDLEMVRSLYSWDRKAHQLRDKDFRFLKSIVREERELTERAREVVSKIKTAAERGGYPDDPD